MGTLPRPRRAPGALLRPGLGSGPGVLDLRGEQERAGGEMRFSAGDLVVVSGLPGSGKSTLMHRVVPGLDQRGAAVYRIDSQDVRERWAAGRLGALPYGLYRPLVRGAHYLGLRRALRSGRSVVVHDCGTLAWVRRWIARQARRSGRGAHLVLLDVAPEVALAGQESRGRGVTGYAFGRHRRAVGALVSRAQTARLPKGFRSVVLLDRPAADALEAVTFE